MKTFVKKGLITYPAFCDKPGAIDAIKYIINTMENLFIEHEYEFVSAFSSTNYFSEACEIINNIGEFIGLSALIPPVDAITYKPLKTFIDPVRLKLND